MKPKPFALLKNLTVPLVMIAPECGIASCESARRIKLSIGEKLRRIGGSEADPNRIRRVTIPRATALDLAPNLVWDGLIVRATPCRSDEERPLHARRQVGAQAPVFT